MENLTKITLNREKKYWYLINGVIILTNLSISRHFKEFIYIQSGKGALFKNKMRIGRANNLKQSKIPKRLNVFDAKHSLFFENLINIQTDKFLFE